jgi:F-type H+-transporting ATPase subunit a
MEITPDQIVYFNAGPVRVNATIVFTWVVMAVLVAVSRLITRRLSPDIRLSGAQNFLEVLVAGIRRQISEISGEPPDRYIPFVGTLFLLILTSNLFVVVPGFHPPTASLSTTAALAVCVFFAVPVFGIRAEGLGSYLKHYISPTPLMLPFHIVSEFSRTLALAVRLFGNIMSGAMIAAILLGIVPLLFPVFPDILGLITGIVQAYIFAVLATVYISSAMQAHRQNRK